MSHRSIAILALAGCQDIFALQPVDPVGDAGDAIYDGLRVDGEPIGCPPRYNVRIHATASLYARVFDRAHWDVAQALCAADSSPAGSRTHLVVLSNDAELAGLKPLLTDNNWIGATDRVTEGTFRWITVETTGTYVVSGTGAPWAGNGPTGAGDCVWIDPFGSLHDEDCAANASYLCECDDRAESAMNF